MLWRLRGNRRWVLAFVALCLTVIACGSIAAYPEGFSTSGYGSPYWACATPTAIPTREIITYGLPTPDTLPLPTFEYTTPEPTATPFYRVGEFYLGQHATFGSIQVALVGAEQRDNYTVLTFDVINHGDSPKGVMLSAMVFAKSADGKTQSYDPEGQTQLGLEVPTESEAQPLEPGASRLEALAFSGTVNEVGLNTNLFSLGGNGGQPVWFHGGNDPVSCPDGEAAWPPVWPTPRGGMLAARPAFLTGASPITAPNHLTTVFGCAWDYRAPAGLESACPPGYGWHGGLDLATFRKQGDCCPIYTPIAGQVYFAGWNSSGYGNLVIVRADIGGGEYIFMYFAHQFEMPLVSQGQSVACGENIGFVGTTGNSTGPHLHWELRISADSSNPGRAYGNAIDPDSPEARLKWGWICRNSGWIRG